MGLEANIGAPLALLLPITLAHPHHALLPPGNGYGICSPHAPPCTNAVSTTVRVLIVYGSDASDELPSPL
ncbi:hypothetical protein PR003_g11557 [Phytophthora rubi]|uniref:Secreted protein n=1 Tax=Phytophthora rubi TaxID=129364 RepID=A0A6A4F2P2_9STRA|nr:hypothetical protein PR001_g16980 [Phytophthora rubi]KAE9018201.1 hypothetical protein PR002_g13163 [Phytophthora rubi]KAE9338307.1 hypothetical protein PR003_g11557 [Phytophthora rubi]